jgi:1-phosphofructokinase family hexose kinase
VSRLVSVAVNPSIDRFYEVDRLVPGAIHRPTLSVAVPGGKGLNAARAAQTLGADVVAISILRGHAGRWIDERLAELGLRLRAVWAPGETRTCISIRDPETDGLTEIYDRGEPVSISDWESIEVLVAEELAAGGEMVTISGGIPPGVDDQAIARICRVTRDARARTLIDVQGSSLRHALTERPWVVKINEVEAGELLGAPVDNDESALQAARGLRASGASIAIVTRGAVGAIASSSDGEYRLRPPAMRGPYAVGSGDAFLGGLSTALVAGRGMVEALALAAGAASANALVPGPGAFEPASAVRLAEAVTIERID